MGCAGSKTPPRTALVVEPKHVAKEELVAEETQPPPPQQHFKVEVERRLTDGEDEALGATFIHHDGGKTLLVASIMQEGLFPRWNRANETTPDNQVKMGDVILMINGMVGNCDLMVPETAKKSMVLIVQRANRTARGSLLLTATQRQEIAPPPAVEPPSPQKMKWFEVEEAPTSPMSNKSTDIGDASPSSNGSLASNKPPPLPPPPMPPPPAAVEEASAGPGPKDATKNTLAMHLGGDGSLELQLEADECSDGPRDKACFVHMCIGNVWAYKA